MATKEFKLPDVGEGVTEGELVQWLVEPGDEVSEDQPVAEVETDKALVEVPSPYDGYVEELLAEEGEMVPVGTVIITFDVPEDELEEGAEAEVEPEPADEPAEPEAPEPSTETETEPTEGRAVPEGRVFAPPSVRRRAREIGVDLTSVDGTGPGGRITMADVEALAQGEAEPAAAESDRPATDAASDSATAQPAAATATETATTPAADAPEAAGRDRTLAAPATRRVADELGVDLDDVPAVETRDGEAFVTADAVREYADAQRAAREAEAAAPSEPVAAPSSRAAAEPAEREVSEPYRGIRKTIGDQMERSATQIPHAHHHDSVDVSGLVETRERLKPAAEERGVRLTFMPFIMKAVVAGLREFPYMNASLDEEAGEIVRKNYYNIGIAVATDAGLMVPVVENVDQKGLLELADELADLVERARNRSISREEMQGSTFTITNFGAIGGEYATPIINYPEVGILGLGEIDERPVVEDGEVVARPTLPLSLAIDHRVIDGAVAAEFANAVMAYLRDPALLLLE